MNVQNRCLPSVLLVAMLLRALVVDGFMPDENGFIQLCTAEGMQTVLLDPDSGEPVEVEDSSAECPWASVFFTPVLFPVLPVLAALPSGILGPARLRRANGESGATGLPLARAPPRLLLLIR